MEKFDEREWAAKTAMRLRVVQATKAETDTGDRGAEVWEFIGQAMKELDVASPTHRQRCLQALDQEFPFFEERADLAGDRSPSSNGTGAGAAAQPPTYLELLDQLLEMSGELSEEAKEASARRLAAAGYSVIQEVPPPAPEWNLPLVLPEDAVQAAGVSSAVKHLMEPLQRSAADAADGMREPHLGQSVRLLGQLTEEFLALYPHVWTLWDQVVASQQFTTPFQKPEAVPAAELLKFLSGEPLEGGAGESLEVVARTFAVAAAFLNSVLESGTEQAQSILQKFRPENVTSVVDFEMEGKAAPADYWAWFCELSKKGKEEELAEEFLRAFGRVANVQVRRMPKIQDQDAARAGGA